MTSVVIAFMVESGMLWVTQFFLQQYLEILSKLYFQKARFYIHFYITGSVYQAAAFVSGSILVSTREGHSRLNIMFSQVPLKKFYE